MTQFRRIWVFGSMLLLISLATFFLFDFYVDHSAREIINTIMRNERAAIQQGNLLKSITKLQTVVEASDQLTGVAVFDAQTDQSLAYPLLLIGEPVTRAQRRPHADRTRLGLMSNLYFREVENQKVLTFLFRPKWILWAWMGVILVLFGFFFTVAYVSGRFERIRQEARASALISVYEQVSHDVKSPLSALKVIAGFLKTNKDVSDLLQKSIDRIEVIVSDLKKRSQDAVVHDLAQNRFDVTRAIDDVVREKRLIHSDREFLWNSKESISVLGSEADFKRVISNLVNNAIEASPLGQTVSLSVDLVDGQVVIRVSDQGCGIPDEIRSKIFRRGFSFGKKGGLGLGLSHAQTVLQAMSGRLAIDSQPGHGTTVSIEVPFS